MVWCGGCCTSNPSLRRNLVIARLLRRETATLRSRVAGHPRNDVSHSVSFGGEPFFLTSTSPLRYYLPPPLTDDPAPNGVHPARQAAARPLPVRSVLGDNLLREVFPQGRGICTRIACGVITRELLMRDSIEKRLFLVNCAAQGQTRNAANNNGLLTIDQRSSNGTVDDDIRFAHPGPPRSWKVTRWVEASFQGIHVHRCLRPVWCRS